MTIKKIAPLFVLLGLFTGTANADDELDFSLSIGVPYVAGAELSYTPTGGNYRYYINGKFSIDSGASIGAERAISDNRKHAIGGLIGAVGLVDGDGCDEEPSSIGGIIGCAFVEAFDWETVNGIGATYSYNFSGLENDGWRIRLEGGYGEGRITSEKRWTGGLSISYQF